MLEGKKVLVVGGSSGIGLAAAEQAKKEGAEVIIASRKKERLDAAAARIGARGIVVDVTDDASIAALFKETGPIDHLVVSAAQIRSGPLKTSIIEDAKATMDSKFWGAWRLAKQIDVNLGGSITFVSGMLAIRPRANYSIVAVTNAALEALGKALALELAPIRVNVVSPGYVDTPIRDRMAPEAKQAVLDREASILPGKRVGTADQIAIQILAFIKNDFANGSVAYIDGGAALV